MVLTRVDTSPLSICTSEEPDLYVRDQFTPPYGSGSLAEQCVVAEIKEELAQGSTCAFSQLLSLVLLHTIVSLSGMRAASCSSTVLSFLISVKMTALAAL